MQSRAVTCIAAEDIECRSYPNLSKNTIRFKRSLDSFSLFVNAIGWSYVLLFGRSSRLDCRFSHWWCNINSGEVVVACQDNPCRTSWWAFRGARLLKLAPRYFLPLDILSMRADSRNLVDDLILTLLHRSRYPKLPSLHTLRFYYHLCQTLFVWLQHPPTPSWWCPTPTVICRKHHEFFTFWEALIYKLVSQQDIRLRMVQRTLLPTFDFVWSWYICYLTKLCHWGHSFLGLTPLSWARFWSSWACWRFFQEIIINSLSSAHSLSADLDLERESISSSYDIREW